LSSLVKNGWPIRKARGEEVLSESVEGEDLASGGGKQTGNGSVCPTLLVQELAMISRLAKTQIVWHTSMNWSSVLPVLYRIGSFEPLGKNLIVGKLRTS